MLWIDRKCMVGCRADVRCRAIRCTAGRHSGLLRHPPGQVPSYLDKSNQPRPKRPHRTLHNPFQRGEPCLSMGQMSVAHMAAASNQPPDAGTPKRHRHPPRWTPPDPMVKPPVPPASREIYRLSILPHLLIPYRFWVGFGSVLAVVYASVSGVLMWMSVGWVGQV